MSNIENTSQLDPIEYFKEIDTYYKLQRYYSPFNTSNRAIK